MSNITRQDALEEARSVLAADMACDLALFSAEGAHICEQKEMPGRRRFPLELSSIVMATMGSGVVVTCSADRIEWAREHLGHLDRDELFSASRLASIAGFVAQGGQRLVGPQLKFLCVGETLRAAPPPDPVELEVVGRAGMQDVYRHSGFRNALSYRLEHERPDMLAVVARANGQVAGIAGASADADRLWQVGVDVLSEYRGQGIGKALVGALTQAVLDAGAIPYYSALVSNLASYRIALGLGYWPAWVEVYTD